MSLRFAPARHRNPFTAVVLRNPGNSRVWSAANDNGLRAANDDPLLVDTLRHFGTHGLHSAQAAAHLAKAARRHGDEAAFARWLGVCRMLDRQLAQVLEQGAVQDS